MILPTYLEQGLVPDVIDDTNPDNIYLGYFDYNSKTDPFHCLIKRIQKVDGITHIKYPAGRYDFNRSWFERFQIIDWRYRDFPLEFSNSELGYLYNRDAAFSEKNIANYGFRLLRKADITEMWNSIDPVNGLAIFGGLLKEVSNRWQAPNTGATNLLKFNARGSGARNVDGQFISLNQAFFLWHELNESDGSNIMQLTYSSAAIFGNVFDFNFGASVRLIKESSDLVHGETGIYVGNDGKAYRTICIYGKEVLSESLAETKFRTGELIETVTDSAQWILAGPKKCAFNNNEANV